MCDVIPFKISVRLLALTLAVVTATTLPTASEISICEVRCGYDRSNVTVSGYVENLSPSRSAIADFDITYGLCQVHVHWGFLGAPPTGLEDGAYVQVEGEYQQYNSSYRGPQIIANQVTLASQPSSSLSVLVAPADWTLIPWGAAGEVAGSCYQLTTPSSTVLVDCGSFMNNDDMPASARGDILDCDPLPFDPESISAVLITHAHEDHTGRLHYLVASGFAGPIYMTHATARIYSAKLNDTLYYSCLPNMREPSVRSAMIQHIQGMVIEYGYHERFSVADGMWATFVDAGHIPGSASIVVDLETGREVETIVFSGDLGSGHHPFLNAPDAEYLSTVMASTLVVESTYGASPPREYPDDLYADFYAAVQAELEHGRLVVIPAFALDRTQRVLAALIAGVHTGRLRIQRPIGVGGKSSRYLTDVYIGMHEQPVQFAQYFSGEFFGANTFAGQGSTWHFVRQHVSDSDSETPGNAWSYSIIVTPSGTGSSSYAETLIDAYGQSDNVTFLQVGWVPDSSPLGELVSSGHVLSIPEIRNVFSGHADISGLVEYVGAFPSLEHVIITHGDDPLGARTALESSIHERFPELGILCPSYGISIDLLDPETGLGSADTRFCPSTACLSASSAADHEGTRLWVCGVVASSRRLDNGRTFLNLEHPYPNQDLTIMVEPSRIAAFDGALGSHFERGLVGSLVCVYGVVQDYEGTPDIVPTEPSQLWTAQCGVAIPEPCRCEE